jgi:hypothetical protein
MPRVQNTRSSLTDLDKRPTVQVRRGTRMERDPHFRTYFIHSQGSSKGALPPCFQCRTPTETDAPFPEPFFLSLIRGLLLIPQSFPHGERCSVSRSSDLFIPSYLSENSLNELAQEIVAKHAAKFHQVLRRRKVCIQKFETS